MATSKPTFLAQLVTTLANRIPQNLADDLAREYLQIRRDLATRRLGGSAPGKFVETGVQILQHLHTGTYEATNPNVDGFLRSFDSQKSTVGDGLRVCGSRSLRAMYSLRSKRNIVHKGEVDMNLVDLRLAFAQAQWFLSELLREIAGTSMHDAGKLIERVNAPVSALVEQFDERTLVLADLNVSDEILILLHTVYPERQTAKQLQGSMERRSAKSVTNKLRELWHKKLADENDEGWKLTLNGYRDAEAVAQQVLASQSA